MRSVEEQRSTCSSWSPPHWAGACAACGEPMLEQTPGRNCGPGRGAHTRSRFFGRNSSWERPILNSFWRIVSLRRDPLLKHGKSVSIKEQQNPSVLGWPILFLIASKLVSPSQVGFSHESNWWVTSLFILIHELLLFFSPCWVGGVESRSAGTWQPAKGQPTTATLRMWTNLNFAGLCSFEFFPVQVPWSCQWWQCEQIQQLGFSVVD